MKRKANALSTDVAGCVVVWLDGIRYFIEDMDIAYEKLRLNGLRPQIAWASSLPWLLHVTSAKHDGHFGGFEAMTTGEELSKVQRLALPAMDVQTRSTPTIGYGQPPAAAVLAPSIPHDLTARLYLLEELQFHCGGRIVILPVPESPPPIDFFTLDGGSGWSMSCKHGFGCSRCPRTPVSPWAKWSRLLWQAYNDRYPAILRVFSVDWEEVPVHHVTVVVFCPQTFKVLKLRRHKTAGGHFAGWSVPGGNVQLGKDKDVWAAGQREWDEEMVGYPWSTVVGVLHDQSVGEFETIAGYPVYRRGSYTLCAAPLDTVYIAKHKRGDAIHEEWASVRRNATVYAPVSPAFMSSSQGKALELIAPEESVTKDTLTKVRHKIHTEGWPYVEHDGEAQWRPWNSSSEEESCGSAIFPSKGCRQSILNVLREVYGWE